MTLQITTAVVKMGILAVLICSITLAQESADSGVMPLGSINQGMEKAQSQARPQAPYQVIREYRLFGAKSSGANSNVVAEGDVRQPSSNDYNIQKSSGSARGQQVVRRILDHEVEAAAKPNQARTDAVTSDNYDFTYIGETALDGQPCYLFGLKPKRKEKDLISGHAWMDEHSFSVLHITLQIATTPSWITLPPHARRTINHTHANSSALLNDAVMRDRLANHCAGAPPPRPNRKPTAVQVKL